MTKKQITKAEAIVDVLMESGAVCPSAMAEKVNRKTDFSMSENEAKSLLAHMRGGTDLGCFINMHRDDRGLVFEMMEEARVLTPKQALDLVQRVKEKDDYTLDQAAEDYPHLDPIIREKLAERAALKRRRRMEMIWYKIRRWSVYGSILLLILLYLFF